MSTPELVLPIHDLARRTGAGKDVDIEFPAPADLGTEVIGVAEGSPVRLDLRVESASDGVYVSGHVEARLVGECVRCLDPLHREMSLDIAELYLFPEAVQR
nr:DUF177 domain-containing protein [Actinomycetales bacterium]